MVMSRMLTFPSASRFFGLTSEYRAALFSQIHEIVFYGKGGYDFHTVYNMPIWLRNFTFRKIQEHYEKEQEAYDNAGKGKGTTVMDSSGNIKAPEFAQQAAQNKRRGKKVVY